MRKDKPMPRSPITAVLAAAALAGFALFAPGAVSAQGAQVALGGFTFDETAPVEVTADQLSVSQDDGTAIFSGGVVVGQGELRISAAEVRVVYSEESGDISRLVATGGVTFVTAEEAAEAREADYSLDTGTLVLTGDVLLTQGPNALAAERMVVNLEAGTAVMEGRVRTVFGREEAR
jgi:lipopolysaccharide export system protein LptA